MRPPFALRTCHPAAIALVIETGEMQHTVKHEDAKFIDKGVAEFCGLRGGTIERYCDLAQGTVRRNEREREDVRGIVVVQKRSIQALQFAVVRKQTEE